jgi:hypothetical protein
MDSYAVLIKRKIESYLKDKRGAINPLIIISVLILVVIFYVWLQMYMPLLNYTLIPVLVNVPMGDVITLLFQYLPLLIAILIFSYAISKSGMVKETPQA